ERGEEFVVACGGSWLRETTKKMKRPRFEIGLAAVSGSDVTTPLGTKRARAQRRDEPAREKVHVPVQYRLGGAGCDGR
ncbi:unnamed protein product, partial [Brassica rapa subsp. narinosa]